MFEVLIKNGRVIDGSGNPWFWGSTAIENGTVAAVGKLDGAEAAVVIDAAGSIIAPGFIDIHTHSDLSFIVDPAAQSKLRQGVTTEVVGNCGGSWGAPLSGAGLDAARTYAERYGAVELNETTMAEYLDRLDKLQPVVNVVAQVGHGTVRANVLGYEDRPPAPEELDCMKSLVAESLDAGALGMSTGLYYAPGSYATLEEVTALAEVVAARDGFVSSHIRDESNYNLGLIAALKEALEVGYRTGVRVQVSHLKALGPAVWGKAAELLALIEKARADGVDAAADQYPYRASGSSITGALIPRWAQVGGRRKLLERLQDPECRRKVLEGVVENYARRGGADRLRVASYAPNPESEGKTMAELAGLTGQHPAELALDMFREADAGLISHVIHEEDLHTIAAHPLVCVGSDGSSLSTTGPLSAGHPHPRHFGTFPRVLGEFVRERRLFRLEEAVRKLTALPAQRVGLGSRGLLRPGSAADIVIFDPERVRDRASFDDPKQYPEGIDWVVVNGVVSVKQGQFTGRRAGRTLRTPSD